MKEWAPLEVEAYKQLYTSASAGNYDIYVVFVEKALSLLNSQGKLGYILPSKFFTTDYGEPLRGVITGRKALHHVIDFGHAQIFDQATTYTCLLFLTALPTTKAIYAKPEMPQSISGANLQTRVIDVKTLSEQPWSFADDAEKSLAEKIMHGAIPLSEVPAQIGRGSSTGADDVFILVQDGNETKTRAGDRVLIEPDILRIPIYATDFGRYRFNPNSGEVIIFPYESTSDGYQLIPETKLRQRFPKTYKYLSERRRELEKRKQFKSWYSFSAPRNLEVHDKAHIVVPLLADKGLYCRLPEKAAKYCLMASGGFSITTASQAGLSSDYVLGLLNSSLVFWRLKSISNVFRGGWITCTKQYVETLPIRTIDFTNAADKARHDRMVALVEKMLALHRQLPAAHTAHDRDLIQRQIDATDRAIDALVYELYGLTAEEIKIVEE